MSRKSRQPTKLTMMQLLEYEDKAKMKPPISVPTESRPTISALCEAVDNSGRTDWVHKERVKFAIREAYAAASSSLLPVGRQPQMDDVMRYLESENFGDIATDHKDGGEFCISDAILSFVRFWESVASLPVGESRENYTQLEMAKHAGRQEVLMAILSALGMTYLDILREASGFVGDRDALDAMLKRWVNIYRTYYVSKAENELGLGESREPLPTAHSTGNPVHK